MMKKTLACILSLALSISSIAVNAVSAEGTEASTVEKHYSGQYYNDGNAQIGGTLNDFIVTSVANPQTTTMPQQNNGTVYFSNLNVKTVYEIGEELDLSDGRAYAGGKTADGVNWDIFAQPLESDFFTCDASEFDNTKPGEYTITVYCKTHPTAKPASFTVTVVGDTTMSQQNNGTVYFSNLNVKTVYEIGEELDLSEGRAYAGGKTADGVNWDIFAQPLESDFFTCDTSEFDNTKPGEYTITVYCKTHPTAKPASFTVTVVGDTATTTSKPIVTQIVPEETIYTTTVTTQTASDASLYGDANCDKSVDISDVTLIKCYMLNSERYGISKQGLLNADVQENGNGVNSNDIIMIQQFTLGIIKNLNK